MTVQFLKTAGKVLFSALHRKFLSQGFECLYMRIGPEKNSARAKACKLNTMDDEG